MNAHQVTKVVTVVLMVFAVIAGIPYVKPLERASGAQLWTYTALGDSLAFGALALPFRGYTFLYRGDVQTDTGNTVVLYNLGVPGWKSSDLLNGLRTSTILRAAVRTSPVVTFDIGGNDLNAARSRYKAGTCGGVDNQDCLRSAVDQFRRNWNGILAELQSLRNFNRTIVRTMDIYNPFVTEDQVDS